jgi:ligand-binding sensor domain-containing protein
MRLLLFFLLSLSARALYAQPATPDFPPVQIGEWRQHLPWQRGRYVSQSDDKVYFATELAVVEIDKADRAPRFLTKIEGLSDAGISFLRFSREAGLLFIGYANSNIDLYDPETGRVANLPFIFKNINITGDKSVYNLCFDGRFAYLATGFGIVKLDLEREEVAYTTFTGMPVQTVAVYDGFLFAGTAEGLFRIALNDASPEDFNRWQALDATLGFPTGDRISAMAVAFGELYFGAEKRLFRYNGATVQLTDASSDLSVLYLSAEGAGLVIGWKKNFDGRVIYREANGAMYDIHNTCQAGKPLYAVEDGSKKFWFADDSDDFLFYNANNGQCDRFRYNSPFNNFCTEIVVAQDKVFVTTPAFDVNLNALYAPWGLYILEEGQWRRFYGGSNPELVPDNCNRDLWRVAPHPTEDKFYAGSFWGGLVEAQGGTATCYTQFNSNLQNAGQSGANRTAIGGLAFDQDGNLWISNYDAAAPIAVLKTDGTIQNFSAAPVNNLLQVAVDRNGYKWFVVGLNSGVLVYDSGNNLDSPADDRYRLLTTANSVLPTNTVNCLVVDLDGDVWIGTSQGTISFECGANVFDAACRGSRRIASVDEFGGYLLETQNVRSIAVDGANRKWFGTDNGIFVQSPTGENPEGRFTATNSPLFDNAVTDIAINPKTGEVWIGTEKGLQSFRSEATEGGRINSRTPYAYPNPVRPDYDGPIAIYGLARDANVKITDIAGNLVFEGKALGGQAVWNGRDYLGRRAASGVYLIFATSSEAFENPDAVIAKVVILN